MTAGVIVTHGRLGEVLAEVVEHMLGRQDDLRVVAAGSLGASALLDCVARTAGEPSGDEAVFLFTDLDGGSCAQACRRLALERSGCIAIAGVNLPMLLEFCHYHERLGRDELLERVVRKAKDGVVVTRGRA